MSNSLRLFVEFYTVSIFGFTVNMKIKQFLLYFTNIDITYYSYVQTLESVLNKENI